MSIPNIENNQKLPRIIIAHYDELEYSLAQNIIDKKIPLSIQPNFAFNDILQKERADIYIFIPPNWTIIKEGIEKAIKVLAENQHINYVYFDYNDQYLSSGPQSLKQIPLFVKNSPSLFNPNLQYLYMHELFLKLEQMSFGIHIAESFTKTTQQLIQQQIQQDLAIIHESCN
jgi:hypothetical protein